MQQQQEISQAYKDAVTVDANGNRSLDSGKLQAALANSGHSASAIPTVMEGLTKFQKLQTDSQSAIEELKGKIADQSGYAAQALIASNYDPRVAHTVIDLLPPGPQTEQVRAQIGNPDFLKQWAQTAIAQSPAQQKMQNEQTVAGIRANNPDALGMKTWIASDPINNKPENWAAYKAGQEEKARLAGMNSPEAIAGAATKAAAEARGPVLRGSVLPSPLPVSIRLASPRPR